MKLHHIGLLLFSAHIHLTAADMDIESEYEWSSQEESPLILRTKENQEATAENIIHEFLTTCKKESSIHKNKRVATFETLSKTFLTCEALRTSPEAFKKLSETCLNYGNTIYKNDKNLACKKLLLQVIRAGVVLKLSGKLPEDDKVLSAHIDKFPEKEERDAIIAKFYGALTHYDIHRTNSDETTVHYQAFKKLHQQITGINRVEKEKQESLYNTAQKTSEDIETQILETNKKLAALNARLKKTTEERQKAQEEVAFISMVNKNLIDRLQTTINAQKELVQTLQQSLENCKTELSDITKKHKQENNPTNRVELLATKNNLEEKIKKLEKALAEHQKTLDLMEYREKNPQGTWTDLLWSH